MLFGEGGEYRRSCLIAVTAALIWALHPVHTSTVLYAVQRMALLSNFFLLLGIYCHLHIRLKPFTNTYRQLTFLTLSLGFTGLLSLFSKENAPSLVFYLLVLEYTLLGNTHAGVALIRWRYACLWLPAIGIVLLPLVFLGSLQADFEAAFNFTLMERLLTQSRVLWEYLAALLLPATAAIGIFHEVDVSTSLFSPPVTLIALVAWGVLLGLAIYKPGRHRIWLFALGWYASGHLVESTILPLELFFHHRNYLAFYGIVFAIAFSFFTWVPVTLMGTRLRVGVAGFYLCLLALNTFRIAALWAQPLQLSERWYEAEPATIRNAEFYAIQLAQYGNDGEQLAAAVLGKAIAENADNFHLLLNLATLGCVNPNISAPTETFFLQQVDRMSAESRGTVIPMQQIVNLHLQGNCPAYSSGFLETLLERLAARSPDYDKGMFQFDLARLHNARGDNATALQLMTAAYTNSGDTGILFNLAIQLINAGRYEEALERIDQAIGDIRVDNNILTGTRTSKLATLNSMREDVLGFMAETQ